VKAMVLLVALLGSGAETPKMEGAQLRPGSSCYSIVAGDKVIGTTWQTITASTAQNKPVWDVVVHQKLDGGKFDMRDHFVLDRTTLLPIRMDSKRGIERSDRGWHRIDLSYARDRITGTQESASGSKAVDVPLTGPTWDGNLWGVTFAALPLRDGASFQLPFWQYDKGFGTFTVKVVGRQDVDTPAGRVGAWLLDAGPDAAHPYRYLISRRTRQELGYSGEGGSQRLTGTCPSEGVLPS